MMENGTITSTNPYNFTVGYREGYRNDVEGPYKIYEYGFNLLPWLIFHSLNNVNLVLMNDKDLKRGLLNMNITKWKHAHERYSHAVRCGGLGDSVWVLVGVSLLAVSAVSSYIGKRKRMCRESRFASFAESLWIHAADILNNSVACAKKVAAPLRYVRAWWLLGVTILIRFWCAGLRSDLFADDLLIIDSLEDLMENPNIICYFGPTERLIKFLEDEDSKYPNLMPQLRRKEYVLWNLNYKENDNFVSGKAVVFGEAEMVLLPALFKKLKRNKRKLYMGKTKYEEFFSHMFFNKRLPRDIKERIDYVTTRLTETRQLEPFYRKGKFNKRGNVFESDASATPISFKPMNIAYLTVLFRLLIIGLSLATGTLFFEYFGHVRWRKRLFSAMNKIGRKMVVKTQPYLK